MTTTDASRNIGEALTQLYKDHDLPPDGGEHESVFHVKIGPVSIPLPNPPARQRAVFIHDVNHLLTGYNAVFSDGEMKIASYEVGTGCGRVWVAWVINLGLMQLAALVRPQSTFRAFVRGRQADSLYRLSLERATARTMTVDELRRLIHLDEEAIAPSAGDYIAYSFWVVATWLVSVGLIAALVAGVSWIVARITGS